jgi:Flp pilus assembly protein TadG
MSRRRRRGRGAVLAAALALPLLAAGCGSDERTVVVNRMVSPEQAMSDLDRALAAGALSTTEYQEQRRKLQAKQ